MQPAAAGPNSAALAVAVPVMRPSAGVLSIRSSTPRRLRWAASASAPYSVKLPDERVEVLAPVGGRPWRRRGGWPRGVEADRVACPDLGEIGADGVGVGGRLGVRGAGREIGGLEEHDRIAGHHDVAGAHGDRADDAAVAGGDDDLHLHRLDDRDRLAGAHRIAVADRDGDDLALHRRGDREGVGGRRAGRWRRRQLRGGLDKLGGVVLEEAGGHPVRDHVGVVEQRL
jgi:hypothetical protein